jgi:hypothetical protein
MTGIWSMGDELKTGRFKLTKIPAVVVPLASAPGLDAIHKNSNWQLAAGH